MEGKKAGAPTSSIVEDLFGRKDKTAEIFGFSTPSSAAGRASSHSEYYSPSRKQEAEGKAWNDQNATADGKSQGSPKKGQKVPNKDRNQNYSGEAMTPCHLSSSLYYGGQDICSNYPPTQTSGSQYNNYQYKKDGEDDQDNSNLASRGNWWQGSLYY